MKYYILIILLSSFLSSLFAVAPQITSHLSIQALNKIKGNNINEAFGFSVAISGNTAVVGAFAYNSYTGRAYVFEYDETSNTFVQLAQLTASDAATDDSFGKSVAVDGDLIVIGAPQNDDNGSNSGSAYVFKKPLSGWTDVNETTKIIASDATAGYYFGTSVAISGDTVVVGAFGNDSGGLYNSGAAYIFVKPPPNTTTATETAKITASDTANDDYFGSSVAISGDVIAVGSYLDDYNLSIINSGSVYVFEKPLSGWITTTETAKLTASDATSDDNFGTSVAIDGDAIVIGALYDDVNLNSNAGSTYVFEKPLSGWITTTETAKLTAFDAAADDSFGKSVAISGNTIVVGAFGDDYNLSIANSGAAYVFKKPLSGWTSSAESTKLTAPDPTEYDFFGRGVAISGDTIIAGDQGDDAATGSAYIFTPVLTVNSIENKKDVIDIEANDTEGNTIDFSITGGDDASLFNIDASTGLLSFKTSPDFENPTDADTNNLYTLTLKLNDDTNAYRFYRTLVNVSDVDYEGVAPKALSFKELNRLKSDVPSDLEYLGYSVAISGNTAVVGAYGNNANTGKTYVYEYNETSKTYTLSAQLSASDAAVGDQFGKSVAIDGDTIVVGAYTDDDTGISSGSAYVFEKPLSGWTTSTETAKLTASDATTKDYFGFNVSISDDTIVIGAYGDDKNLSADTGSAYVFEKPLSGWTTSTETAKLTASDASEGDNFAWKLAINGNIIVIGTYGDNDNGANSGSAYLFEKPLSGWTTSTETAKLTASDAAGGDQFGRGVAIDGDTIVVGSPLDDDNGSNSGSAYIFEKPLTGWTTSIETTKIIASDAASDDLFGYNVAISGDMIVVGSYLDNAADIDMGSIYLFEKPSAGWVASTESVKITASDAAADDQFGSSVAISGDTIIVGAPNAEDTGEVDSGAAYIFKAGTQSVSPAVIMYLLN